METRDELVELVIDEGQKVFEAIKSGDMVLPENEARIVGETLFVRGLYSGQWLAIDGNNVGLVVEPTGNSPHKTAPLDLVAEVIDQVDDWVAALEMTGDLDWLQWLSSRTLAYLVQQAGEHLADRAETKTL